MPETLRLISASSEEWNQWLAGVPHDFHHLAEHHLVWEEAGMGEGWLAVVGTPERFFAWPYLQRSIPQSESLDGAPLFDVTAVDGYAGPLYRGCRPGDPFCSTALDAIFRHWEDHRIVSAFARFHPLLNNEAAAAGPEGVPGCESAAMAQGLRHQGHTVSMDLHLSDEEAHQQYRGSHLRQIRRAFRLGLQTQVDNSPEAFQAFVRLYYGTMERNQAHQHYFFSEQFLSRLIEVLGPGAAIHTATYEGRIVGAILTTEHQGIVQYLLGGVDDSLASLSPTKAMLESIRQWAAARGNHVFHLGGGRGCQDQDPLFYFKAGFSSTRHCYYTGRWILNPQKYEALATAHCRQAAARNLAPCSDDFFPLYRAPLTAPAVADAAEVA